MALDKNKIVAEASKYAQKGQYDKAIKLYEKILSEDPKDVRVRLKIGETQQKKNDLSGAAETFHLCAQAYGEQGFALKAVAVYKQIARLTPDDPRVPEKLAALYQQLGLLSDAMGQMHALAQSWERAGDEAKVMDALRRMAELDPDNVATAVKLGELYVRGGQPGPALEQFRRAAAALKKTARVDEYLKVAERVASLAPQDLQLTRELANVYLARGDTKRALAKLQLCFKADPKDVETLTLLAQAFRDLGQLSKTLSVYKELAHVYAERGRAEDARATFRKVLELAPDDAEAQEGAGVRRAPEPARAPAWPPASATPAPAPAAAPPSAAPAPASAAQPGPAAPGVDAIPRLLTELDVYLKYGLTARALEHVNKVLALDPGHAEAHERAREIHVRAGDPASAAREGALAVRGHLAKGRPLEAEAALARLRELAPGHPELPELEAACGPATPPATPAGGEEVVAFEGGGEEVVAFEGGGETVAFEGGGEERVAFDDGEALVVGEEDIEPVDEDALALSMAAEEGQEVVPDDEPPYGAATAGAAPARAGASAPSREPAADVAEVTVDVLAVAAPAAGPAPSPTLPRGAGEGDGAAAAAPGPRAGGPAAPGLAAPISSAAGPAAPISSAPGRLEAAPSPPGGEGRGGAATSAPLDGQAPGAFAAPDPEALGELDFFIQQGLLEEARELLEQLASAHPGDPEVAARLAALAAAGAEQPEAPAAPEAPPAAAPPSELAPHAVAPLAVSGDDTFDLGKELASELAEDPPAPPSPGDFQYSVDDVFSQFKKGVEQTVRPEDGATHYDLGIAYKEMGLLDDAVQEFEVALAAGGHPELDCLNMIGLCRMAQGAPLQAADAFRRALGSDGVGVEQAKALHYELGLAYEGAGDPQAALFYLQKIVRIDPRYREVAGVVARLGGGPGRPPAPLVGGPAAPSAPPAPAATRPAPAAPPPPEPPAEPEPTPVAAAAGRPGPRKKIGYV
ncbi:tetratricopeptide repeat protein [Anaeromyxobacter paludicola]|uniref:Bacterial transcriptional activator domain-containing protein n=1 Tax=Anaeromyxobacter paludicola TaxID=2918171 RepID=A0ABM7XAZ3_9BACT|nr:tetratricopeptide repeat protein [Anaeromyxobacter paludicola]BDG09018.1 hypothetical protein AMPC_21310 [Anaeromyxobacter paludicola]